MSPAQTAPKAITAAIPFKNTSPPTRTMPALVDCVGVFPAPVAVAVSVPLVLEADTEGEEGEADEKTPPAASSGVVEFKVCEAARAYADSVLLFCLGDVSACSSLDRYTFEMRREEGERERKIIEGRHTVDSQPRPYLAGSACTRCSRTRLDPCCLLLR